MKHLFIVMMAAWAMTVQAEDSLSVSPTNATEEKYSVEGRSFWSNWYVQVGADMSLQNPYAHNFMSSFKEGMSFGLSVNVGKWLTPVLGLRGHINWENGITKSNGDWLAPFYQPGVNHDKGGYVVFAGDIQFDVHNLFLGYDPERKWNLQVFPRAGGAYSFGVSKGTPLMGFGIGNTWKVNERIGLYADVAYNMVSSGFTGMERTTGVGTNSNGFFDIAVGAQINLGKHGFVRYSGRKNSEREKGKVQGANWRTNAFWDNWYLLADVDMTMQNPYGCNFSETFPKGKSFGVSVGAGKWFTPEFGIRGRVNWGNGLVKNDHFEWLAGKDDKSNYEGGGYLLAYIDVQANASNIIGGYQPGRKWNVLGFARAGLAMNRANDSDSPMVGVGLGLNRRLSEKWSIYTDMAYQMSTSEFGSGHTGMKVSSGSNGWLDWHVGVQYDLGTNGGDRFYASGQTNPVSYDNRKVGKQIARAAGALLFSYGSASLLKACIDEKRPDGSDYNSFPSRHAALAFAAATVATKEWGRGKGKVWVPVISYGAATAIGVERVVNDHHYTHDVLAGAVLGWASAELSYWLTDLIFGE